MVKSLYTPVSGALSQEKVLEIISNNLANLNTTGYKADKVSFERLSAEPFKNYLTPLPPANFKIAFEDLNPTIGNEVAYVGISDIVRDHSQGPAIQTYNQTDLMIEGPGYFSVHTKEGDRLSRDGSLNVNRDGYLVTKSGDPVLGHRGTIQLGPGSFEVSHLGEVIQGGQLVDRMKIVEVESHEQLERVGNNYYIYNGKPELMATLEFPALRQGYLEGSNVNAIQAMTEMILSHRSYEAYQKAVSNYDQMMEKSSNTIGDVRA